MSTPAIILAAGLSTRMKEFKPLLPLAGLPMIRRTVDSLSALPEISPLLVITGHRSDEIRQTLANTPATLLFNPHYQTGGMVSSAQIGVQALPPDSPAFLLSLGDQPALLPTTLFRLLQAHKNSAAKITVPSYHGKHGHPILMSIDCANDVSRLGPTQTLKDVVNQHRDQLQAIPTDDDPGVITDADTPEEFEQLIKLWQSRSTPT